MNNYTTEDILKTLDNRIDYNEIARVLELDLNQIADATWEDGEETIEFKVFFDFGEFDTFVNLQAPGEGQPQLVTPVLISLLDGQFSEPKGPQLFNLLFRIEAFAFARDKDPMRRIFETYNKLNQGAIYSGMFSSALTTSFTEFPVVTPPEPYKGMDRFSVFMLWNLSLIYTGQLSNDVKFKIDGEELDFTVVSLARHRATSSAHFNEKNEMTSSTTNQNLNFTAATIYDGTEVSKKILRNIKNFGEGLSDVFLLEIDYPAIEDVDSYYVVLTEGSIDISQGSVVNMTFSFVITDEPEVDQEEEIDASKTISVVKNSQAAQPSLPTESTASKTISLVKTAQPTITPEPLEGDSSKTISLVATAEAEKVVQPTTFSASKTISLVKTAEV